MQLREWGNTIYEVYEYLQSKRTRGTKHLLDQFVSAQIIDSALFQQITNKF